MTLTSSTPTITPAAPPASRPMPLRTPCRELRAPNWLQVLVIFALLGSAIFVALDGHYLWCALLAFAALAFGASFLLRRMVGDDYGRA
jgi:hypothetical protein